MPHRIDVLTGLTTDVQRMSALLGVHQFVDLLESSMCFDLIDLQAGKKVFSVAVSVS